MTIHLEHHVPDVRDAFGLRLQLLLQEAEGEISREEVEKDLQILFDLGRWPEQPRGLIGESIIVSGRIPSSSGLQEELEMLILSVEIADCSFPLVQCVQTLKFVERARLWDLG